MENKKQFLISNRASEFFNYLNNNLTPEIDMLHFISEITENNTEKLKILAKDIEEFRIDFTANEVVESWFSDKVYNPKSVSESFKIFEEMVLSKIEEFENVSVQTPDLNNTIKPEAASSGIQNDFPKLIFRDYDSFQKFENYARDHIVNVYKDYSYLKKRMVKLNLLVNVTDNQFAEFLYNEGYLKPRDYDHYLKEGKFCSKAHSVNRENNFNNIFSI